MVKSLILLCLLCLWVAPACGQFGLSDAAWMGMQPPPMQTLGTTGMQLRASAAINLLDTNFVSAFNFSMGLRNDFNGRLGFRFTAQASMLVTALGRTVATNNWSDHTLAIYEDTQPGINIGVLRQSAPIIINPRATPQTIQYTTLSTPVTLVSNVSYVMSSTERYDYWWEFDYCVSRNSGIGVPYYAFSDIGGWTWNIGNGSNRIYIPVDFTFQHP